MKKFLFFLLTSILLTNCTPATADLTATFIVNPTVIPTITSKPALTLTPTFTPWPIPSNVIFCLDEVESDLEKNTIRESIRRAHQYFVEQLGVEPSPVILFAGPDLNNLAGEKECSDNSQLRRIRNDLRSSWEKTGGYAVLGVQVTNTNYFVWKDNAAFRKFTVAHEYVHQLQMTLLGRGINGDDAGPRWLLEGSAQVIAYYSQGVDLTTDDIYWEKNRDSIPFSAHLGAEGDAFWDIAPFAVSYLASISPEKIRSITNYFSYNPTATTWESAFERAFGLTFEEFNNQFEAIRKIPNTPIFPTPSTIPTTAPTGIAGIRGKVILVDSSYKFNNYVVSFCNIKNTQCLPGIFISDDGSFIAHLDPGDYKMSVNPLSGRDALGWYTENGLVQDAGCAQLISVNSDPLTNLTIDFHPITCPTVLTPTPETGIIVTGIILLSENTQKISDISIAFCNIQTEQCLPEAPVFPDGTFSMYVPTGKYRISVGSHAKGQSLGWYTKQGLVADPACSAIITIDLKHEMALIVNLQEQGCK